VVGKLKMGIKDAFISKPHYVDILKLIRSIQRAEGNIDCYRRDQRQCEQRDCVWRDHCLKEPEGPPKAGGVNRGNTKK